MTQSLNENSLAEQPVIDWMTGELGYEYVFGPEIGPEMITKERENYREVILRGRLKRALLRINPQLGDLVDQAIDQLARIDIPSLDLANREVYKLLIQGAKIEDKSKQTKIAKFFDFENPENNEFLVVNQFAVQGLDRVRRPDIVVFVNGIPLAIFEVKNPTLQSATLQSSFKQLQEYKKDIPEIFKYNQILVISDLTRAKHGTINSSYEWFGTWKAIDNEDEDNKGISELETTVKGIFHKARFMDIFRNFIAFEADSEKDAAKYTKKMCMYHQYYGVNKAINETLRATSEKGNRKIGVFWHTQGSGKSLSMVFYANKAMTQLQLESPTLLFLTDRNDLDGQLYKTFLRTGYATLAKQAENISDLKKRLVGAGAELIFTTIQKFETELGENYGLLSDRRNIIVIADEAHRSQYAKLAGNVREALPEASFMGITGTPVSLDNRDTQLTFGPIISAYQIQRAVLDEATVPIYYEGRLVPLHLTNYFIDEEYDELLAEHEMEIKEGLKAKFKTLENAVGSKDRLQHVSADIVEHFNNRGLLGKGMVVTISRRVAVEMYKLIKAMPNSPEIAVVISNPEEFKGQIQNELDKREIEKKFKNPDDPLKIVIVCDMWLTGFDVPALHTMYIDKPLKNHSLMQAIARVNRIFKDKPGGLIVDYIGIADDLKKALSIYSSDIRKEAMIPLEEVVAKMKEKYEMVKGMLVDLDFSNWKRLPPEKLANLFQQAMDQVVTDEASGNLDEHKKKRFLQETSNLFKLFALVMPRHEANEIRNEVEFFQAIRKAVVKRTVAVTSDVGEDIESAIKDLISKSITAEGVIDIFAMKNKTKPNISIFDEKFLEEVKNVKFKNLAIELLKKLLRDELRLKERENKTRFGSMWEILEDLIEKYENRIIDSAKLIEKLIELAKDIKNKEKEGGNLGLDPNEVAFYDIIASSKKSELKNGDLKTIVKQIVNVVRRDAENIDWSDNEVLKARIRANVRLLLLKNHYSAEETETLVDKVITQARFTFSESVYEKVQLHI